ncbi:MAG: hypothetical protein JXA74_02370 [Anaerolineae bacterium]|nr:hypothetical protein [Anaerolineae bacterium]
MREYEALQRRLAQGWNTWNTRSVLSHVHLPDGFALNLGLKEYMHSRYLAEALVGRKEQDEEQIHPGPHAYDGSYTSLRLRWQGVEVTVQSATDGDDLLLLVTPHTRHRRAPLLVVESGMLWNRPGAIELREGGLCARTPSTEHVVFATCASVEDASLPVKTPYLGLPLSAQVALCTGRPRSLPEISQKIEQRRREQEARVASYGDLSELYRAIQTVMAWDTIYEPEGRRVVTPVSRIWNVRWGGFVLFEWDTYFAAYMAGLDSRDLAYANAVEITRAITERGFVPNFATVAGVKSRDRSQPPVGALMVRELYRKYGERWLLEEVYDALLTWNRWWAPHRSWEGLLCWGSDPYEPVVDAFFEVAHVHDWQGAAYESGLDNSPMYDDVPFDGKRHLMALADVGLNALYIADCDALADIASALGREADVSELRGRAAGHRHLLNSLWHEPAGTYLNRRLDTGVWSYRLSPTHFYALLARAPSQAQARWMIAEHLRNPDEFWGEWVLPSIARGDPAYSDQTYWRGRIWAPMNLLVYLGLREYDLPQARADLAERSAALLLKEWQARGHVHENYNADTGEGCDVPSSDGFYHWGGLLGMIALSEAGHMDPEPRAI